MKTLGFIIAAVGLIWTIFAYNADTTVQTGGHRIGSIYVPSQTVHNIGKLEERRTDLTIGLAATIAGFVMLIAAFARHPKESTTNTRTCPFCAETVKIEAKICKHCGRDIEQEKPQSSSSSDSQAMKHHSSNQAVSDSRQPASEKQLRENSKAKIAIAAGLLLIISIFGGSIYFASSLVKSQTGL